MRLLVLLYSIFLINCAGYKPNECMNAFNYEATTYEGHRALSRYTPNAIENSFPALIASLSFSHIKKIEFDIRTTKDNQLVVIHDESTCRVSDYSMNVSKTNYEDLPPLKDGSKIPLVSEYLDLMASSNKPLRVYLDVKQLNHVSWETYKDLVNSYKKKLNFVMVINEQDLKKNNIYNYCDDLRSIGIEPLEAFKGYKVCK